MLQLTSRRVAVVPAARPRSHVLLTSAGRRVWRKYRQQAFRRKVQRREYRRLKSVIPSLQATDCQDKVHKVTVIEEAIKYIDQLHLALALRFGLVHQADIDASSTLQNNSRQLTETVQQFMAEAFLQSHCEGQQLASQLSQCWSECQQQSSPYVAGVPSLLHRHDNRLHLQ